MGTSHLVVTPTTAVSIISTTLSQRCSWYLLDSPLPSSIQATWKVPAQGFPLAPQNGMMTSPLEATTRGLRASLGAWLTPGSLLVSGAQTSLLEAWKSC